MNALRCGAAIAMVAGLAGCSALPASAPTSSEVLASSATAEANGDFVVIDLNRKVASALAVSHQDGFAGKFQSRAPAADLRIAVGDTLQIGVLEAAPGLFNQAGAAPAGGPAVAGGANTNLLPVTVGRDGAITVPFAGRIVAAGKSADEVRAEIEKALSDKTANPQVEVYESTSANPGSNSTVVGGEVNRAGLIALQPSGTRLLDAIAQAGGAKFPAYETTVRLSRNGHTATASLQSVVDHPNENVFVYPHDDIYLSHDPRTFTVLGASVKVGRYNFGTERVNLAEAVGEAGGMVDAAADPGGIFVFRFEPGKFVSEIRPDLPVSQNEAVPVIYRLNLRNGEGYFNARQFAVRDKDVILLANSDGAQLLKFMTLLRTFTGTADDIGQAKYWFQQQPSSSGTTIINGG